MPKLNTYLRLLRVNSYVKNLFVFAPLFFHFQFDNTTLGVAFVVFVLFCFLASSVYIFNDIFDLESDRKHPVKKHRPITSGVISVKTGSTIAVLLLLISLSSAFFIKNTVFYMFLLYLIINLLYNLFLKQIPVLDIIVISSGFIIRLLAGSYANDIPASHWILIMTFLLSLFLGFSKRRADIILADHNGNKASNIKVFSLETINKILSVFVILICGTYIFYTFDDEVITRIGSKYVFLTNIFVVLGVFRYMKLIKQTKQYKDPTTHIVGDWKLQLIIVFWGISFVILRYI